MIRKCSSVSRSHRLSSSSTPLERRRASNIPPPRTELILSTQIAVGQERDELDRRLARCLRSLDPPPQVGWVPRDAEPAQAAAVEVELGREEDPAAGVEGGLGVGVAEAG